MKTKNYTFWFVCLWAFFTIGCSNKTDSISEKYYSKENFKTLQNVTAPFGVDLPNKNTLLLIVRDTECFPCLQELQYWNTKEESFKDWNIQLFVVSKYTTSASAFLEREEITLATNIDTTYSFMRNDIVPQLPFKVLIKDDKIKKMEPMGSGSDLPAFVRLMKD